MGVNGTLRVGVVCDLAEERWPSMDLVAEMLVERLGRQGRGVEAVRLQAPFRRRATAVPLAGRAPAAFTFDRMTNRLVDYPRWLRDTRDGLDVFHVVDHSYAHLVRELPPERTVVTCHDVDTFRSVLHPSVERRSAAFRAMTRRILDGFRRAARVTCDSAATRDAILAYDLIPAERLAVVPNGVHPDFSPAADPKAAAAAAELVGPPSADTIDLLHVGSTIPRKNIRLLLHVVAGVRGRRPVRLIQVGGALTPGQRALAVRLGIVDAVVEVPFQPRPVVAELYRRAQLVLLPSLREGFGLPVVEAMACGAVVVASDLPVLREVGGYAATYCSPDNDHEWVDTVIMLSWEEHRSPETWEGRRQAGMAQAAGFTWDGYAQRMINIYDQLAGRAPARQTDQAGGQG
jgi:glycosyltransferase involved in cell wall biosynthesis